MYGFSFTPFCLSVNWPTKTPIYPPQWLTITPEISVSLFPVPTGEYILVNHDTYFLVHDIVAASSHSDWSLPSNLDIKEVDINDILPGLGTYEEESEVANVWSIPSMSIAINISPQEWISIMDKNQTSLNLAFENPVLQPIPRIASSTTDVELSHTLRFGEVVEAFLGDGFTTFTNKQVLKGLPFCKFATSKPDVVFYHREKYAIDQNLYGVSGPIIGEGK